MSVSAVRVRRWTREEYLKMGDAGVFAPGERVELIEGEIVQMTPQKSLHASGVYVVHEVLRGVFAVGFIVRAQLPLALDPDSEPEPDTAVVRGTWRHYVEAHPAVAVLVIEVSDTTLEFDRGPKAWMYAKAGIPEYWIVNLIGRVLEVHRDPGPVSEGSTDHRYRSVQRLAPHQSIRPLGAPDREVRVADLLP